MEEIKKAVSKVSKMLGYKVKTILKYGGYPIYGTTLTAPEGLVYVNLAYLNGTVMILHNFMDRRYVCNASKEEWDSYPDGYSIWQDNNLAYIVTDYNPEWIKQNIASIRPMENIFLSKRTHALYEKVGDYTCTYNEMRELLSSSKDGGVDDSVVQYITKECTYEKQIIEPILTSLMLLSYMSEKAYGSKTTPYGETYTMAIKDKEMQGRLVVLPYSETLGDGRQVVRLKCITGVSANGKPVVEDIPDDMLLSELQKKMVFVKNKEKED